MADTTQTTGVAPTGAPKETPHWYHGHRFHLGAGVLVSIAYAATIAFVVPLMSAMKLSTETNLWIIIAWSFFSIVYAWRKGKRITAIIDRKNVLTGKTAKWELFWLLLPYLAFIFDGGLWLGTSIQYSPYQAVILFGTVVVTTFVLDTNSSFITDLLKAAPIAERVEHEKP